MKRFPASIVLSTALLASGCAAPEPEPVPATVEPAVAAVEELPAPYTAAQIRDEWSRGFRLVVERTEEGGAPIVERWTVIESDEDRATIEFAELDASGVPTGEAAVDRTGWNELRDHARFAPGSARRVRLERESELGSLSGWLYTVDEEGGLVTEYFFADGLPGAPVEMVTRRGGEIVATFRQLERGRVDLP